MNTLEDFQMVLDARHVGNYEELDGNAHRMAHPLVLLTMQRLVAALPTLPAEVAAQCRNATTLEDVATAVAEVTAWAATAPATAEVAAAAKAIAAAEAIALAARAMLLRRKPE